MEESILNGILTTLEAMDVSEIIKTSHDAIDKVTILTPQKL